MLAGGLVLSDDMPAEAGADDGLLMPEAPMEDVPEELLPEGDIVSVFDAGGGGAMDGEVEGAVEGELMGAGVMVSSAFFPQAPSASNADRATAVATADLEEMEDM